MNSRWTMLVAGLLLLVGLGGCSGGGGGSGGGSASTDDAVDPETGIAYVNSGQCVDCHDAMSWSESLVADYLAGKHVVHSTHIDAAADAACLDCHDPLGDGAGLEGLIDDAAVPEGGLAAVGCENCHGPGSEHLGSVAPPVPTPDHTVCARCHNELPENHLTYHPEADRIGSKYAASAHAASGDRNQAVCVKCHTDEGGRAYRDVATVAELETVVVPLPTASPVQCRTCHDPHNAGRLLKGATEVDGTVLLSAEYATCTTCHQAHDAQLGDSILPLAGSTSTDGASGDLIYHAGRFERVISSSHHDDPATTDIIEGYTINPVNERACRDCHDVHSADLTINRQWARSGHGGRILAAKEAIEADNQTLEGAVAYRAAGTTTAESAAWIFFDWDDTGGYGECQRCHTATGFRNHAADQESYNPADNDFSHLVDWTSVTSSGQNELLYCWGCHADNSGGLRNPGAITPDYEVAGQPPVLPDLSSSNGCASCHAGLGNAESYALSGDPATDMSGLRPGFGANTKNVTATHYLPAAATLFQSLVKVGYEYPGKNYGDLPYFAHDSVDLDADEPGVGSGPCVGCHMRSQEPHSFGVVETEAGVIQALTARNCVNCHDGEHGAGLVTEDVETEFGLQTAAAAAAFLNDESEGYQQALECLDAALAARGVEFTGSYPYFSGANWVNEGLFGAAHNFNYLHHEPGAYAHNSRYAKRLLFDSIDWVDNDNLDGEISLDAVTYPDAVEWLGLTRP